MEKLKRKNLIHNSIFTSTLVMLMFMSICTMIAMWLFVSRIYVKNRESRIHELNRSQISRVSEDMDTRLTSIANVTEQMLFSKNEVSLMTIASEKDSDIGARVIADLNGFVVENRLVDDAYMYLPTTDEIFSASGSMYSTENFPFVGVLQEYLDIRTQGRPADQEITTKYLAINGELFVISDFSAPYFIGAMIVRIDMKEMSEIVQKDNGDESGYFLVCNSQGEALICDEEVYQKAAELFESGEYETVKDGSGKSQPLLVIRSEKTGLVYGLYVGDVKAASNISALLLTLLPFILIYGALAMAYSLYITRRIYRPINRLMNITLGQRRELDAAKTAERHNEMEYLEQVFQDTWGENEQNRVLLANISDDVLEQMFRSVISGRNVEESYIEETLHGLGLENLIRSRFVVLSGWLLESEERERSSMEAGLYRRSIRNFLNEYPVQACMHMGIFMDQNVLAIIVGFPEETSALEIKKTMEEFDGALRQFTEQLPFSLLMGSSKTCQDISSLRGAYHDAYTQMEYLRYVAEAEEDYTQETASSSNTVDQKFFQEYAHRLVELAEKDSRDETADMINTIISEASGLAEADWHACMEAAMDILMEKMIALHISSEEMKEINAAKDNARNAEQAKQRDDHLYTAFSLAVKAIFNNSRKSRYRYVDLAKDYISTHYADGNLSLNEVAEAVGISAPYLSGIFAESEKIGFSVYLSNYRVSQAKQFLNQTTQNVTEIGYKCGFNSAQSFSRVFKKHSGFTPGQYRELHRGRGNQEE